MSTATQNLPLSETSTPSTQAELVATVRAAFESGTPVYPLGGETALDYGLPVKTPGIGLSLADLNRVVDYPARDMTVTVEAGITIRALAELLAAEGQWLPVDVPDLDHATLGGLIATNASGPRRYGQGTIRDYVIGITAVDGRGAEFHGGGRVVKNVAGYDFCKLLVGSLGTLGVITQVTLKVKPRPRASAIVTCDLASFEQAETLLAALGQSRTTPTAVELLAGPAWNDDAILGTATSGTRARLVVGLEGTLAEVDWMVEQLRGEWNALGITNTRSLTGDPCSSLWQTMAEFPAHRDSAAVIRANVLPSAVTALMRTVLEIDARASIQAHAGNGVIIVRFGDLAAADVAATIIKRLRPAADAVRGSIVVVHAGQGVEITRQLIWGPARADLLQMVAVKRQFDPRGILNPGRFIFSVL